MADIETKLKLQNATTIVRVQFPEIFSYLKRMMHFFKYYRFSCLNIYPQYFYIRSSQRTFWVHIGKLE